MPEIIILAGPNGAGKTSFANQFLRDEEGVAYVNADEIARSLARKTSQRESEIQAARLMLRQIDALVAARHDFMFETTLSSLGYARKIPAWRDAGYHVGLVYLRLPSIQSSLARVAKRVADGGHSIPDAIIRRRFNRSLTCLVSYKTLVNEWYVCDSLEGEFPIVEAWND
ncbi:MAG: zeta toxin family protein [Hyphomonadaceae bacterium]